MFASGSIARQQGAKASLLAGYLLLACGLSMVLAQTGEEQAFRNELELARRGVSSLGESVKQTVADVEAKAKPINEARDAIREDNKTLGKVEDLIGIKTRAKELVSRQLKRKIKRLEEDLEKAAAARKSGDELVAIQKRANAYRNTLKQTLARYGYEEKIRQLKKRAAELRSSLKSKQESLRHPLAALKNLQDFLDEERTRLAIAEEKLNKLLLKAPERLKNVAPPFLETVKVREAGLLRYHATWISAQHEVDERIRLLEQAIDQQKGEVASHKGAMAAMEAEIIGMQKECDRLMQEYRSALYWQAFKSIGAEIANSAVNILLDAKEMGPYAFFVEAVDVVQQSARGQMTADYGLPKGTFGPNGMQIAERETAKKLVEHFATKENIKGTLKDALQQLTGGKGTADSPRQIGSEYVFDRGVKRADGTAMKTVADLKHGLRRKHLMRGARVALDEVKEGMKTLLDPRNLKANLKKKIDGMDRNFAAGLATTIAKEYAKEQARQTRVVAWLRYAKADALRSALLLSYKTLAATKRFDELVLETMNEHMQELIQERDEAKQRRALNVIRNQTVTPGKPLAFHLEFTTKEIEVSEVSLGGQPVSLTSQTGIKWIGSLDLNETPASSTIKIQATDKDSGKVLDDPATVARFNGNKAQWGHWEPGPDQYHRLLIGEPKPVRSFVFLIDCSGSMDENNNGRLRKAQVAAEQMFRSGRFVENKDEVSLWVFSGGSIANLVPFSQEFAPIRKAITGLKAGGGTPLAEGILRSGDYLHYMGRGEYKALIVLTDGEASGVGEAVAEVRSLKEDVSLNLTH